MRCVVSCGSSLLRCKRNYVLQFTTLQTKLVVQACHTPRQPPQNHPSGHHGGWATLWSAEEMLDRHHQRMDLLAHALLQKRLEEDLCWIVCHVHVTTSSAEGLNWTQLNLIFYAQSTVKVTLEWNVGHQITSESLRHRSWHTSFYIGRKVGNNEVEWNG